MSFNRKLMVARAKGEEQVVLTLEEAEKVATDMQAMSLTLTQWMQYVPEDVLRKYTSDLFDDA